MSASSLAIFSLAASYQASDGLTTASPPHMLVVFLSRVTGRRSITARSFRVTSLRETATTQGETSTISRTAA